MTTEPDVYIPDYYLDPEAQALMDEQANKAEAEKDNEIVAYLDRRALAYRRVFTPGTSDQEDIDIVLNDLMYFCKFRVSTFNVEDGAHALTLMHMKEGRREVMQRIIDHSRLSVDALVSKYTDATKPKGS